MSTLALSHGFPLRLNWPRIGALSGTMSLHLLAISLLLIPATAMQLMKPQSDVVTAHLVAPKPPPVEEPVLPKPPPLVRNEVLRRAPPIPVRTAVAPPVEESNMSSGQAEPGPPSANDLPAAPADTEPTALAYLTRTRVAYPREAITLRQQGTVILRVLVGTDGVPQAVEIEKSSGSRALDNAARDAVRRWTFQAGTRNGISAALWARVPIKFDLTTL
jgi:protein TonB